MPNPQANKTEKFKGAIHAYHSIHADENGELPSDIMLLKAGKWGNSVKGALRITKDDLAEMKANFDAGVGRFGNGKVGLPVDFSHFEWGKAGAWINKLELRANGKELWSVETEYTTSGREAVLGGDYKGISPSFYPSDRGGYTDPEDFDAEAKPNTLVGAAFTNIPFFKGLSAVRADNLSDTEASDNMLFISKSASAKEQKMSKTLDEVRVMAAADLTDEDKALLEASKAELSAEELTKFGLKVEANNQPNKPETFSAEDRQILADINSGAKVVMTKDEHDKLLQKVDASADQLAELKKKEVEAHVTTVGINTGRIKADQLDKWTSLILADESNKELLEAIPTNKNVEASAELGDKGGEVKDKESKIFAAAVEIQRAAREAGKPVPSHSQARRQAEENLKNEENQ